MPCLWKLLDSLKRVYYLQQKSISKPGFFGVVILDGLVKLLLSDVEKANVHLLLIFGKDFFERDGLKCTCIVCPDAIFDFLAPKGVDFLIRRIQAREQFIDNLSFVHIREGQRSIENLFGVGTHLVCSGL